MGQKERTERYKKIGAAAGMLRVEVLVPPEGRSRILDEAKRLRMNLKTPPAEEPQFSAEALSLHDEALKRYRTRCFWNARPPKTVAGFEAVIDRLDSYGDMEAWRLATRIRRALQNADR